MPKRTTSTPRRPSRARRQPPAGSPQPAAASPHLGALQTIREFWNTTGVLTEAERRLLVDQALLLIEQLYVHLPLKKAMHAIDPVQALKLLRFRLPSYSERKFHDAMIDIFTSLRDLHTNYLLPIPYQSKTAFLPFLMEDFVDDGARRFLVSKLIAGFSHPQFRPGVEVSSWNGIPIERAVELNADRNAGSNLEARWARGLEAMTIRPLAFGFAPDEEWVIVGYRTPAGADLEIKLFWQVFQPDPAPGGVDPHNPSSRAASSLGIDFLTEAARRAKKALFNPKAQATESRLSPAWSGRRFSRKKALSLADTSTESLLPDVFSFRPVATPSGTFGYVRIWTFSIDDVDAFLREFIRILELLPQNGLIIDVRGNGGGVITAGEGLLQLLTPKTIEPCRLQFLNTSLTAQMARSLDFLKPWLPSISQAVETGAAYSQGFPIDEPAAYNRIGQRYWGPVVLITDALCYSTTDIFAAGFQDHAIGPILGVAANTGAGGANVWTYELLRRFFPQANSPFRPLPKGASFRVSVRRTVRVGERAGMPLEDLGVTPDYLHRLTRNDLLNGNADLIARAGTLLAQLPAYLLQAGLATSGNTLHISVNTLNLNRLDVFLDGRPLASQPVSDGAATLSLPKPSAQAALIELKGFKNNQLAAIHRIPL